MRPLEASDPRVVGPYRLLGLLGSGGMGNVYLGQSRSGRRLAIKVIRPHLAADPVFRERFAREVAAARSVSPLFTAAVVDADAQARAPWLATTFIDGISLEDQVLDEAPLGVAEVLSLAAGLAEALSSIHRVGLIHRDLKPSNILLDESGPHIIDFGLALSSSARRMTTSLVMGTPAYMAPERLAGDAAGPPSDIFSLGATLFFALTGRDLVDDASVYEQITQISEGRFDLAAVPRELRPLIVRCICHQPKDRPTAEELTRIVIGFGASMPVPLVVAPPRHRAPVPRQTVPEAPEPPGWSRRSVLTLGGVAGVALGGAMAAFLLERGRHEQAGSVTLARVAKLPSSGPSVPTAGSIIWQAESGGDAPPPGPKSSDTGQRVMVDRQRRIITTNGPRVFASDASGTRLWTHTLPSGPSGTWLWGDAVLVTDSRRLWLLDAASGEQRFAIDPVATETIASRADNSSRVPISVGAVALSTDRAFLSLGTATVAIDRRGKLLWRRPATDPTTTGPHAVDPVVANANWLVTQDITASKAVVTLVEAATGIRRWTVSTPAGTLAPPPPPGPPGQPPDSAWPRSEAKINDTHIVVRDGPSVRVIAIADGRIAWQTPSPTPVTAIAIVERWVLVAADQLFAYELTTGARAWQAPLRGARIVVATEPLCVIAVTDRDITGLDTGGQPLWQTPLPDAIRGSAPDTITADPHIAFLTVAPPPPDRVVPSHIDVVAIALDGLA